ncbi:MAG TPA: HEAT repeat domain-containing protein [Chthonomonadales bacterium]|nr:HEAT repeat domain-containing protein [Chthonomonadales bacterium]
MNRKYLNYAIFGAIVLVVVGLAVHHSRHMRFLVDSMAGQDRAQRIASARELVLGEQFMDSITGESVEKRIAIVQALEDWASEPPPAEEPAADEKAVIPRDAVRQMVAFLRDADRPVRDRVALAVLATATLSEANLIEAVAGIKDGDANTRKASVAILRTIGQDDPAVALEQARRALPDTSVEALQAALARRRPEVAEMLVGKVVALIKADAAARATGGDVLGALVAKREKSVAALMPLLDDADEGVRSGAVSALGKVGSPTPVPRLIEMMAKDTPPVRRVAIGAIALIAHPSCEPALVEAIANPNDDNEARAQAAVGLGRIGSPSAIATLIRAIDDFDLRVQGAAVSALAVVGPPAVPALDAARRRGSIDVQVRALSALGGMQHQAANPALLASLRDPDSTVRRAAVAGLGFPGNAPAVGPLTALLGDRDGSIATAASTALAQIGPAAQAALVNSLADPGPAGFFASQALAAQGNRALPGLRRAAAMPGAPARWSAYALGFVGGPEAVVVLRDIAGRGDEVARQTATQSLRRLGVAL